MFLHLPKYKILFAPAKVLLGSLLFWGAFFTNTVSAQSKTEQAQVLWGKRQYAAAIAALQKEAARHRSTPQAQALLGNWLYQRGRWTEAATTLEAADAADPNGKKPLTLQLLKAHLRAGNWAKAQSLATQRPAQLQSPEGQRWRAAANVAQKAPAGSVAPLPLGAYLNSEETEYFPLRASDGQSLTFTRRVRGMNDKLLRAMADTCTDWFYGEPLPYPLNSTQQESGPAFSADGHYLFLARGEMRSGDGWSGGGSDLFMAYRAALNSDSTWSIPEPFGATINTPATETAPALSADNRTLYFASDRPGGLGGLDLWCSHFQNGRWQEAQNLGPGINSAGNETAPFLCADGQTLYFSSDGRLPTLGGYDLYRSRRSGEDWGAAEHLPAPFNGPGDELSCSTTPTGDTLYFATDRQGPVGNLDIWVGQLPPDMRPVAVQVVRAHVRDSLTGQLMPNALVEVVETATNQALGSFTSNRGDASLTLFLQPSVDYKLSISRSGYLPFESVWNTDSMAAGGSRSLALLPDTYVLPTWDSLLLRIHFQKNERSLSDSLREEVAFALAPWRGVTGAQILLWGFTDNSGMPLLNEELSALRAGLVGIVARQVGLEPNRITEQGWGEVSPMAPNDTEEGRYLNRRVEIILRRPVRGR